MLYFGHLELAKGIAITYGRLGQSHGPVSTPALHFATRADALPINLKEVIVFKSIEDYLFTTHLKRQDLSIVALLAVLLWNWQS